MKVAIVHDFLMQMGGAEKVVEVLHTMFPDAPVYTSAYDADAMPASYRQWDIRTTFLQKLPAKRKTHRMALPLYPLAFESFDLSAYDLVISSSSAFGKGVITHPQTTHICYTHAPMRYAWTTQGYVQRENISRLGQTILAPIAHYLRTWDMVASTRPDRYVANSSVVARRIAKYYRQPCDIVYPPVDTSRFQISPVVEDYYMIASRFIPYKRLDLAIEAFTRLGKPLKIVGGGRQRAELQALAGPTVEFLGRVSDDALPELMARARGYVMPGEEDFGIAPVEANACGRPVIAFGVGGALDSQRNGITGILFPEQTVDSLCQAVLRAEETAFDPETIRAHSQQFSTEAFMRGMRRVIAHEMPNREADALYDHASDASSLSAGAVRGTVNEYAGTDFALESTHA